MRGPTTTGFRARERCLYRGSGSLNPHHHVAIAAALLLTILLLPISASLAGAAPGRVRFPLIAGAAAVVRPPAQIAAPSLRGGATLAGIVVAGEARSRPDGGRRVWLVGTGTSWSSEPQVLLVLGSAYDHGRGVPPGWPRPRPTGSPRYGSGHPRNRPKRIPRPLGAPIDGLLVTSCSTSVGGPGRVAIHGRDGASLSDPLGSARSHGCIRIDNTSIDWMAANIPQGTQSRSLALIQLTRRAPKPHAACRVTLV